MEITAEPRSDQLNADDLVGGPRTVTITDVVVGAAEQKYDIRIAEEETRVWRPPLTVLRILIAAWGSDSTQWVGKRATLYRDESVRFGKEQVGGIRVSHLSGIDRPLKLSVTRSRGKRAMVTIDPLPDQPKPQPTPMLPVTAEQVAAETSIDTLRAWWPQVGAEAKTTIENRVAELQAEQAGGDDA